MFRRSASLLGSEIDGAFLVITGICVLLFVVIMAFMVYFLWRYRKGRNAEPSDIEGNPPLELTFLGGSIGLVMFMFFIGLGGYRTLKEEVPPDAFTVKAHAQQWLWTFEYPGGVVSPVLRVPKDRPVRVELDSKDVIHGFFIPAFRVKQDAMPGSKKTVWFTPDEAGEFDLFCTQYCGVGHSKMITKVEVAEAGVFDEWLRTAGAQMAAPSGEAGLADKGKSLYQSKGCAACHSIDGSILVGPSWKGMYGSRVRVLTDGKEREVVVDEAYIRRSEMDPNADIVVGFPPVMPSQKGVLSDDEVKSLIEYMKTLK